MDVVKKYEAIISKSSYLMPAISYRRAQNDKLIKVDLEQITWDSRFKIDSNLLPLYLRDAINEDSGSILPRFVMMKASDVNENSVDACRWKVYFDH